jgi:hypothetical protein
LLLQQTSRRKNKGARGREKDKEESFIVNKIKNESLASVQSSNKESMIFFTI